MVSSTPDADSNDLTDIAARFARLLGRGWDRPDQMAHRMAELGFVFEGDVVTDTYWFDESPEDRAVSIERRDWSSLWDLDPNTWAEVVQPVIDELRALPEPERPRSCRHSHMASVYRLVGER